MRSIKEITEDIAEVNTKRFKGSREEEARAESKHSALVDELERARKAGNKEEVQQAAVSSNVVYLPQWFDGVRGVPNGLLRSALFGVIKRGVRQHLKEQELAAVDGVNLRYTGERLDQNDLTLYLALLHLMRATPMGDECRFTAYELLKALGKKDTGENRKILHTRLIRLKANAVEIDVIRYSYAGSLIHDIYRDRDTQEYVVVLNPKLKVLFEPDQYTLLSWQTRQLLEGRQLAQWLYSLYSSHAKPYPMRVEKIHKLCGSEAAHIRNFKIELCKALDDVAKAYQAIDAVFKWEIIGDLLHVDKPPSDSQKRHLLKDKKKPR